jgi:anti-sigma regulatory factor (Ser/Thr protein kinase)
MSALGELTLDRDVGAPALAREFARGALRDAQLSHVDDELIDEAVLLVSELVTNAVVHTDSEWVRIELSVDGSGIRCVVVDADASTAPTRRQAAVGGLGLVIVDALATRSGCDPAPNGKAVWFELDLRRDGSASS